MASLFFQDYHFPSELYSKETGDFTTPIRTLLDFTPHILQQLPKEAKDQEPIRSDEEDSWTKNFMPSRQGIINQLLSSERVGAVTEFVMKCGHEYIKSTNEKKREDERFKRFEAAYKRNRDDLLYSSEEEEEQQKQNLKKKARSNKTLVTSAAAAGALSLSLYSTYQASIQFSEISFHNQLELLIAQVKSILQSTEVWLQEHDKMDDPVPDQVRTDVTELNGLLDLLVRLDPRANKKIEAAGWSVGALGGLSALGGLAWGSAAAMTGGAALVVGGAIVMISSKASSKSQLGARILLENQVREKVANCQKKLMKRQHIIEHEFQRHTINTKQEHSIKEEPSIKKEPPMKEEPSIKKEQKKKQPLYA